MSWSSLIDSISRGMAFFPPSPPSYTLEAHGDGGRELYIAPTQRGLRRVLRAEVFQIPVGSGRDAGTVVAALIPAPAGSAAGRRTLLHSHGNAVDLGQMLPLYEQLAKLLRCNIMAYDYRGYGRSTGRPGASTALADAAAGHERLLQRFGRRPEEVILYGQSVGSGPTCWLAARSPGLGGAVLHSAFLSGVRVIKPGLKAWPSALDIFPNLKYVPKVEAPTLVVHVSGRAPRRRRRQPAPAAPPTPPHPTRACRRERTTT
jgi:pimeloyl-ACP methyl ester carboxylesterase